MTSPHWWKPITTTRIGKQSWRCVNCRATMTHNGDLPSLDRVSDWTMADGETVHVKMHGARPACIAQDKRPAKPRIGLALLAGRM